MNNQDRAFDIRELYMSILMYALLFGIVCFLLYTYSPVFITIWRAFRLVELNLWNALASVFNIHFFENWLFQLQKTPPYKINWAYVGAFESSLNAYMRFIYTPWMFYFAHCMHKNKQKVKGQFNVQTLMEQYADESESIASLVHDNPLKHNRYYDFNNRNDYHNRHAQAISPQRYIEACPPPNASHSEMQRHFEKVNVGKPSPFRPIAIIDRTSNSLDFCRSTARVSLERQLTSPPIEGGYYLNEMSPARLFDSSGAMIDLVKTNYKPAKGKMEVRITGGFSQGGLINNGRDYCGTAAQLRYAFNASERKVFDKLCRRYNHPSVPLADFVLQLTKRHAYRRTYLVEFIRVVSQHAIIASTEFYMMQREDRALYFAMYSAREEKPFYEALGIMSHYEMEKAQGFKIVTPYVNTGIDTLELDARRIANKRAPQLDLINELNWNMVQDPDLEGARAYTDADDTELTSLLKASQEEFAEG